MFLNSSAANSRAATVTATMMTVRLLPERDGSSSSAYSRRYSRSRLAVRWACSASRAA